jgi:hypothetical protein
MKKTVTYTKPVIRSIGLDDANGCKQGACNGR